MIAKRVIAKRRLRTEPLADATVRIPAREALRAIAELLAPNNPAVIERVTLAVDYPERYVAVQNQLYSQTLEKPHPELGWCALVDALHQQELLLWVDWNEDAGAVLSQLRQLKSAPTNAGSWEWADDAAASYVRAAGLDTLLARTGNHLAGMGVSIAWLDSDSDTFLVVFIPSEKAATLVESALTTGHRVRVY